MIRTAVMALERWVFDDDSEFIGIAKFCLVVSVVVAAVMLPFYWFDSKAVQTAEAQCLAAGGGWAVIGSHDELRPILIGKIVTHSIATVTDYGCVEVKR